MTTWEYRQKWLKDMGVSEDAVQQDDFGIEFIVDEDEEGIKRMPLPQEIQALEYAKQYYE